MPTLSIRMLALTLPIAMAAAGQPPPDETRTWVPGEAIVRFSPDSGAAAAVGQALEGRLHEEPALVAAVEALSERLDLALRAKQLTSGSEVVLEIDREKLEARLLDRVREDARVEEALVAGTTDESPFADPRIEIRVRFPAASEAARTVAAARAEEDDTSCDLDVLGRSLTGGLELPFGFRASGETEMVLRVGLRELTEILLDRLRAEPEVQSAEPNRLLGIGT